MAITVKPIDGYNKENYEKNKGIGDDTFSDLIIDQVINLILDGYSYNTIRNALTPYYHWNSYEMKFVYNKSVKQMLDRSNKQIDNLKEKQLQRLLNLMRKCQASNDRKGELAVLAEINKLNSLYVEKVEVTNNEVIFRIDGEEENN